MPKSKYPGSLDTSVEIPVVRDNILEIGSDALNSLRSAIFQIERTLGINPQGATGNTVSDRISKSLDGNGNILKSALDRANILSGPISDSDVSKTAAIKESKLKLNFPTHLLQDEISILNSQIDAIILQVEELNAILSAHINPSAVGRHPATAISVSSFTSSPSSSATMNIEEGTLQATLGEIYDSHINYDGSNISEENNSHLAKQIHFDATSEIEAITDADDVQEAIEDVAIAAIEAMVTHQDLMHSNGILKRGTITSPSLEDYGTVVLSDEDVSFIEYSGDYSRITRVIFDNNPAYPDAGIFKSDILRIVDGDYDVEYEIQKVNQTSGNIDTIDVFGMIPFSSSINSKATITRNKRVPLSKPALLSATREKADLTSAMVVQVANPNSASVTTVNAQPQEITVSNRHIKVSLDGAVPYRIDMYNGDASRQTIDSVVSRINEQVAERALSFLAYKFINEDGGSELSLVHNLPDDKENSHTIEISRYSGDSAIESIGFSDVEGVAIGAKYGGEYYIHGKPLSGLRTKIETDGVIFYASERIITTTDTSIDFVSLGINRDDLVVVTNSSGDDGTYVVSQVQPETLELDAGQLPTGFSEGSGDDLKIYIFDNSVSFENMTFDKVSGTYGAAVVDIFMDSDQMLHIDKRIEYAPPISGSEALIEIVDFDFSSIKEEEFELKTLIWYADDMGQVATSFIDLENANDIWVSTGEHSFSRGIRSISFINGSLDNPTYITHINSRDNSLQLTTFVGDQSALRTYITSLTPDTSVDPEFERHHEIDIYGFSGVNRDSCMHISRVPYLSFKGRVGGSKNAPMCIEKVNRGNVGVSDISSEAKYELVERPIKELRVNGVISGCEIFSAVENSDGLYEFNLKSGIVYVDGKRIEVEEQVYVTDVETVVADELWIAVNSYGDIVVHRTCDLPWAVTPDAHGVAWLARIEKFGPTITVVDMALLISSVDYVVLNAITVSPVPGMGHFVDLGKAIAYTRRFSQIFPLAGTPSIHLKSGVHKMTVNYADAKPSNRLDSLDTYLKSSLFIDFPITITGEGESTVLEIVESFTDADVVSNPDLVNTDPRTRGSLYIFGSGIESSSYAPSLVSYNAFDKGTIKISDLTFRKTRLDILEPKTEVSSEYFDFKILIDNVKFDFEGAAWDETTSHAINITNTEGDTDNRGNIIVTNSSFKDAMINFETSASLIVNMNLISNFVNNNSGSGSWLRLNSGSFSSAPDSVNLFANTSTSTQQATMDGTNNWSSVIGGDVSVGDSLWNNILYVDDGNLNVGVESSTFYINSDEIYMPGNLVSSLNMGSNDIDDAGTIYCSKLSVSEQIIGSVAVEEDLTVRNRITCQNLTIGDVIDTSIEVDGGIRATGNLVMHGIQGEHTFGGTVYIDSLYVNDQINDDLEITGDLFVGDDIDVGPTVSSLNRRRIKLNGESGLLNISPAYDSGASGIRLFFTSPTTRYWGIHTDTSFDGEEDVLRFTFDPNINTDGDAETKAYIQSDNNVGKLNFTGQHKLILGDSEYDYNDDSVGMIVVSSGRYNNTDQKSEVTINEALPVVSLSSNRMQKSAIGVISGIEDSNSKHRKYSMGAFVTVTKKNGADDNRLHVNSLGEGGIWVCNINGDLENGDYITTCEISGLGMKQDDDLLHNYTVAKITCDCNFDLNSNIYKCVEFEFNGEKYKKAFVGCTYHCG